MMKRKISVSKKDILIGVIMIGFILLFLVYFFVYLKYLDMTDILEVENTALLKELEDMDEYYENDELYLQKNDELTSDILSTTKRFPAEVREEDAIMLAATLQEKMTIYFNSITLRQSEELYRIPQVTVASASMEELNDDLILIDKGILYSFEIDYDNLKKMVDQINHGSANKKINNISLIKNNSGNYLQGSMLIDFYSLEGNGKEYEVPDITQYLSGTNDIFNLKRIDLEKNDNTDEESDVDEGQKDNNS